MADVKTLEPKTLIQKDAEAIDKYNRILEKAIEREEKLLKQWKWRGSSMPPFNIEHMPFERQRLSGAGMTAEDRALRKQWLQDQTLSANEPRHVPELKPKNIFRRVWAAPWDAMESALRPLVGTSIAGGARNLVPKSFAGLLFAWAAWYNLKYSPASWENLHGWNIYGVRPRCYPDDPEWPHGHIKEDFSDNGFKSRAALTDIKSSE